MLSVIFKHGLKMLDKYFGKIIMFATEEIKNYVMQKWT